MLFKARKTSKQLPKSLPNLALQGNKIQRYTYEKDKSVSATRHGIPIPSSSYDTQHDVNRAMLLQTLRKKYFSRAMYRGEIDWNIMAVAQTLCVLPIARAVLVKTSKELSKYSSNLQDEHNGQSYNVSNYLPKMSYRNFTYYVDQLVDMLYTELDKNKSSDEISNKLTSFAVYTFGFTRNGIGQLYGDDWSDTIESAVRRNAPLQIVRNDEELKWEVSAVHRVVNETLYNLNGAIGYINRRKRPSKWKYDNEEGRWKHRYLKFQPTKHARTVYNMLSDRHEWNSHHWKNMLTSIPSVTSGDVGDMSKLDEVKSQEQKDRDTKLQELAMPKYIDDSLAKKIVTKAERNFKHAVDYLSNNGGVHGKAKLRVFKGNKAIRKALQKLTVTQGEYGVKPRNVHRIITDRKVFKQRKHIAGGSIMIDCSGSMGFTSDDVREIVEILPATNMAGYVGYGNTINGYDGDIRIIARDGRMDTTAIDKLMDYGCNSIDLEALKWLAKLPKPRIWVSDMQVVGVQDSESGSNQTLSHDKVMEIFRFMTLNEIIPINDIEHVKEYAKQYAKYVG